MTSPIVFLDTETTGLSLHDDIWEFAAIRREPNGVEGELHIFIQHDEEKCRELPDSFLADHLARFPGHNQAVKRVRAARMIADFLKPDEDGERVHIVGAVPNFDTERLAILLDAVSERPPWHYHLIDVENLAVGHLASSARWIYNTSDGDSAMVAEAEQLAELSKPPWKSDDLSRACGVEPPGEGERHTAMGDARWARALYDAITGGAS